MRGHLRELHRGDCSRRQQNESNVLHDDLMGEKKTQQPVRPLSRESVRQSADSD
jgi:hypothetical protein